MGTLASTVGATLATPGVDHQLRAEATPRQEARRSQLAAFTEMLEAATQRRFANYGELHAFSVAEFRTFWDVFLQSSRGHLGITGSAEPVCVGDSCEHARFFPQLQLNYADSLLNLAVAGADAPAVRECHADGSSAVLTRGELRGQVAALAQSLVALGVRPGDRVIAVLRNDARAVTLGAGRHRARRHALHRRAGHGRAGPARPLRAAGARCHRRPPRSASIRRRRHRLPTGSLRWPRRMPSLRTLVRLDAGELPPGTALEVHSLHELPGSRTRPPSRGPGSRSTIRCS